MSVFSLRFVILLLATIGLLACGEKGSSPATQAGRGALVTGFGEKDAECFAGIVRAADDKRMTPADFKAWRDRLNDQDKKWLAAFSGLYSDVTRVVSAHLGKTSQELYDAKLLTAEQQKVYDSYVGLVQESDAAKANTIAAGACSNIGFSKGLDMH